MAIEEQVASQEEDEKEDDSPLDSGQRRNSLVKPCLVTGRESRAKLPQGGSALANNYMGARSAHFEQMDVDPPEDNNRQESIVNDNSHNVRVEDEDESANNSWRMHVKALFTSLNEAEHFNRLQPMKRQEILMNFLQIAHLYKPSNGYKICRGPHWYTFGEIISKSEGQLIRLNQTSAENAAEGRPPVAPNTANEHSQDSVPPYGGTTYRFTTPQGNTCGQMPVWPGEEAACACHTVYNDTLRAEFSEFDGNIEEINPIWIIV